MLLILELRNFLHLRIAIHQETRLHHIHHIMMVRSSFVHRLVDVGSGSGGRRKTADLLVLAFLLMRYEIEDTPTTRLRPRRILSFGCKTRVNVFDFFI